MAIDQRGHGETTASDDKNLAAETLSEVDTFYSSSSARYIWLGSSPTSPISKLDKAIAQQLLLGQGWKKRIEKLKSVTSFLTLM